MLHPFSLNNKVISQPCQLILTLWIPFHSAAAITRLIHFEEDLTVKLRKHVESEQGRLAALSRVVDAAASTAAERGNVDSLTMTATDGVAVIHRIVKLAQAAEAAADSAPQGNDLSLWLRAHANSIPTTEDLHEAQAAILRVQRTYEVTAEVLVAESLAVTTDVCSGIANEAVTQEDWVSATDWLSRCIPSLHDRANDTKNDAPAPQSNTPSSTADFWSRLAYAAYKSGDLDRAVTAATAAVKADPSDFVAEDNLESILYRRTRRDEKAAAGVMQPPSPPKFENLNDNLLNHSTEVDFFCTILRLS